MEPFLGQIELFPYNFAPSRWALCDGRLVPIQENVALFSLLGTQFGGDGKANYALPDLRGKGIVAGLNYYIALQGVFPSRD